MQNSSSKLLDKAVGQFASLPGIGRKTALKFVLYLLKKSPEEVNSFVQSIEELKKNIQECTSLQCMQKFFKANAVRKRYAHFDGF